MRLQYRWLFAGLFLVAIVPQMGFAFGRGGFAAGGRGGVAVGGRGGVAVGGRGVAVDRGPVGGTRAVGGGGHTFVGPNGGTVQSGRVGGVIQGPAGGYRAAGAGGTRVTTPGGRTLTDVHGGRAAVGPYGAAGASSFGRFVGGSGPAGSAAIGHRGGVAVGPYGGVAAGGSRVAVGHSTRYMSSAAIINNAAVVRGGYHYGAFATRGWWGRYPGAWRPVRWVGPGYWGVPVWGSLATFCAITAPPIYYDYGGNVIIQNENVYVGGEQVATADQYATQATQFADAGRQADPAKDDDWQALGVFGMTQPDEKVAQRIFQLAVNKAGIIRGNYYDAVSDTTTPVYGSVDPKSQRACWSIGDKKTIIFETGLNNLTKAQTSLLVHYGTDRTDQMILVRLEDSKGDMK